MVSTRSLVLPSYGARLQPREAPLAVPTGTEVLLRVHRCGICHTDVHLRHGYYELGGGRQWRFAERGLELVLLGDIPVVVRALVNALVAPTGMELVGARVDAVGRAGAVALERDHIRQAA